MNDHVMISVSMTAADRSIFEAYSSEKSIPISTAIRLLAKERLMNDPYQKRHTVETQSTVPSEQKVPCPYWVLLKEGPCFLQVMDETGKDVFGPLETAFIFLNYERAVEVCEMKSTERLMTMKDDELRIFFPNAPVIYLTCDRPFKTRPFNE